MKAFNRLILFVCAVMLGAGVLFNVVFPSALRDEERLYVVEINRFMALRDESRGEEIIFTSVPSPHVLFVMGSDILSDFRFFSAHEDSDILHDVFSSDSRRYVVRPVFIEGELHGFYQFELADTQNAPLVTIRMVVNVILILLFAITLVVLLYIKYQIIVPFNEISYLPIELSKGKVKKGIPESKSRYFGNFIWGLNMMRETLIAHKEREFELLKDKKMMILSISHDINTPLSAIKLSTKAMTTGLYPDPHKQQEILAHIARKTVEIENFVADIIKISKEDLLTFEVGEQEFYLADVIHKITADYDELLSLQKTEFIIDSFSNRLLTGDIERLVEVLQNLIENAIKYGDGKLIQISFDIEEDFQLVTVANTGNSMQAGELIHVFESFWRGSNIGGASGSGLGLYICRRLMRQMGGDIYAQIEDTVFYVTVVIPLLQ